MRPSLEAPRSLANVTADALHLLVQQLAQCTLDAWAIVIWSRIIVMEKLRDFHGISPRGLYASLLQEGWVIFLDLRDVHHEDFLDLSVDGGVLPRDERATFTQDESLSVTVPRLDTLGVLQGHRDIVSACLGWRCCC